MESLLLGRKAVVLISFLFHAGYRAYWGKGASIIGSEDGGCTDATTSFLFQDTGPTGEKEPASLEVKMVVVQRN